MTIEFASAVPTLFASLQVKAPNAQAGDLFEDWVKVPGVGSITLPTNQSNPNTQVTLEGTKQTSQFAERGQIQVPLSTLLPHSEVHEFFRARQGTGEVINVRAQTQGQVIGTIPAAYKVLAGSLRTAVIEAAQRDLVLSLLEPAHHFEQTVFTPPAAGTAAISATGVVTFAPANSAPTPQQAPVGAYLKIGSNAYFITTAGAAAVVPPPAIVAAAAFTVVNVCQVIEATPGSGTDEGRWIDFMFDPAAPAPIAAAQELQLQLPALTYDNIACTVSGYDDGELPSQAAMTGSITLIPSRKLGRAGRSIYA